MMAAMPLAVFYFLFPRLVVRPPGSTALLISRVAGADRALLQFFISTMAMLAFWLLENLHAHLHPVRV